MTEEQRSLSDRYLVPIARSALNLFSPVSIPKGAIAIKPFYIDKFLGRWYEIARMDHKFERGLELVTATDSLLNKQTIRGENRGYSHRQGKWKISVGRAKFVGDSLEGRLKVSFLGL